MLTSKLSYIESTDGVYLRLEEVLFFVDVLVCFLEGNKLLLA